MRRTAAAVAVGINAHFHIYILCPVEGSRSYISWTQIPPPIDRKLLSFFTIHTRIHIVLFNCQITVEIRHKRGPEMVNKVQRLIIKNVFKSNHPRFALFKSQYESNG